MAKKTVKSVLRATVKSMGNQAKKSVTNYGNLGKSIVNIGKNVGSKSQGSLALQGRYIPGSLEQGRTNLAYKIGMEQNLSNAQNKLSKDRAVKNSLATSNLNVLKSLNSEPSKVATAMAKFGKGGGTSRGGNITDSYIQTDGGLNPNMTDNGGIITDSNTGSRYSGVGNVGSTNASGNSGLTSNIINAPNVLNPNSTKLTFPEVPTTPVPTITAPVIPPPEQTNTQTALEEYLASLGNIPNNADAYNKAQKQSGILQAQQTVSNLTGQLNQIVAQGQANQLKVIGQGRGIPEAILGGQQAQFARETAIAALPVQAQLSAAQGNLEMAQDNLDTLFKIYADDARNEYETRKEQKKLVYDIANAKEKRALEIADKLEERAYQETKDLHDEQSMYAKMAFANNQASLGSQIAKLNYKSPTFKEDLSRLTTKLNDQKYSLEIAKLQNDLNNSGTTINTKVLNTTQFKAAQAAQNLKLTLDKAKAAVQKYGNREVISGEGAGILNSLKVQLRSEISTALEQGVVVPGEAAAFDQIAGQLNKSFFIRNKKTLASLNSLSSSMDGRIALQRSALTNTYGITPDQVDTLLNITNLSDQEFADMDALID